MADCSESLLADWRANRYLAEFVESGILEFQLHRAEEEKSSDLPGGNSPDSDKPATGRSRRPGRDIWSGYSRAARILSCWELYASMQTWKAA